jgi:cytochrome c556
MENSSMKKPFVGLLPAALTAGAILFATSVSFVAQAQNAPGGANAGRQAVESRKAVFTLVGANFRPLGGLLRDGGQYNAADVEKRISRIAFLSTFLGESFPDNSNIGEPDTKAKPEIWTNRADFDSKLKDFIGHVAELQKVNAKEGALTEPFKTALAAVAQDCKTCHDTYKLK